MNHIFFNIKKIPSPVCGFPSLRLPVWASLGKIVLNAWHGENVIIRTFALLKDCSIDITLRWAQFLSFTVGPQINIIIFCIITYNNDINNICFSK